MLHIWICGLGATAVVVAGVVYCLPCKLKLTLGSLKDA